MAYAPSGQLCPVYLLLDWRCASSHFALRRRALYYRADNSGGMGIPAQAVVMRMGHPMAVPAEQISSRAPRAASPRLWVRLVLGLNVALLGAQLAQLQREWMTTPMHGRGLAVLILLLIAAAVLFAISLISYPTLHRLCGRFVDWVLAERVRTWTAAFLVFEVLALAGLGIDRHPLFPHGSELMGVAGFLDAVAILLGRRLARGSDPLPDDEAVDAPAHPRRDRWIALGIAAAGVAMSAVFWLYAPPLAYGNFDSYRYFFASEGLLGAQALDFAWYTYPYPLVIAATRLIADTVLSIVILQHALRIALAVLVFWSLRDAHRAGAAAAGFLIALSPIAAYQAHQLLDASLYGSLIGAAALMATRIATRARASVAATVGLGLLCAWIAVLRPMGQLLILPMLLVIVGARLWRRPPEATRLAGLIAAGFAAGALIMAGGQWLISREFRFGTQEEAFYAFPTIYLGLYDPANGPVAASYQAMLDSGECAYMLPAQRWEIAKLYQWPHDLHHCATRYNEAHGTHLSTRALYLEAIRAKPLRYVSNLYQEARLFLTHSDTGALEIEIGRMEQMPFFTQTFSPVDGCKHEVPEWTDIKPIESWFAYTCTYPVEARSALGRLIPQAYDAMLLAMQPYRLQGQQVWARFWAALALIAFAWLEGPRRLRPLVALGTLLIAYHAVISAAAMFPQPRYVYFNVPFFLILVAVVAVTLWQGIRALRSALGQVGAFAALALLPLLPALIAPLWTDTEWTARYWQNTALEGRPAQTRREAVITYDWGEWGPFEEWEVDRFSARWERTEYFEAGRWTFAVRHDDGARVYVDGELIYENWAPGFHDWAAVEREMTRGRHRLRVEYYEDTQTASMQFGYYPAETP